MDGESRLKGNTPSCGGSGAGRRTCAGLSISVSGPSHCLLPAPCRSLREFNSCRWWESIGSPLHPRGLPHGGIPLPLLLSQSLELISALRTATPHSTHVQGKIPITTIEATLSSLKRNRETDVILPPRPKSMQCKEMQGKQETRVGENQSPTREARLTRDPMTVTR